MAKFFNINGACNPDRHYMVDLTTRLQAIKGMVDRGEYFVINKARQLGKTTVLQALSRYLEKEYRVVHRISRGLAHFLLKMNRNMLPPLQRNFCAP